MVKSAYSVRYCQWHENGRAKGLNYNMDMRLFISLTVWMILLALCWPLAILLLLLYPFIWLVLLPLRLLGWGVTLSLSMIAAVFMLPFALLK